MEPRVTEGVATNCEGQHMLSALNIAGPIWLNNFYTQQLKIRTSVNVKYINCAYLLGHKLNVTPPSTRRQEMLINQKLTWFRRKKNNVSLIFSKGTWINTFSFFFLKDARATTINPTKESTQTHFHFHPAGSLKHYSPSQTWLQFWELVSFLYLNINSLHYTKITFISESDERIRY